MKYDVMVVGGGVESLATARYLAKSGCKTLVLEQFLVPNSRGSSAGQSRTIRYTYDTIQHAVLMPDSFKKWRELEKECGKKLLTNTGIICMCKNEYQSNIERSLKKLGNDFTVYKGGEVDIKFPGLCANGLNGIYEKDGGILYAEECVRCLRNSFIRAGGELLELHKVDLITPISSVDIQIKANGKIFHSKSVVLTCGSWINKVLKPLNLQLPLTVLKTEVCYWKALHGKTFSAAGGFPVSSVMKSNGRLCYSLPSLEYPGLVKVALHDGVKVDPDLAKAPFTKEQELTRKMQFSELTEFVKTYYPGLIPVPALVESCLYTMTTDEDFILDRHPQHRNIIIGAGFSGHGFKMAPVVGEILGGLVMEQKSKFGLSTFAISRFQIVEKKNTRLKSSM